ncbi:MAG: hypothetical protein JSR15_02740 [Proteobacteria bacterium]|nr:hypothetical protein [Pseudomonadota bacterium]
MWQQLIVAVIVIVAAVYAARALGPRRWRRRPATGSGASGAAGSAADDPCGCGKDGKGCH